MLRSNSEPNSNRSLAQTAARIIFLSTLFLMSAVVVGTPGVSRGAVTVHGDSVTLAWDPSNGAEGYYLVYAPFDSEPFKGPFTGRIDVGDKKRFRFEIHEGEGFHVAVQGYNEAGTSTISNVISFIRPIGPEKTTPVVQILANHTPNHLAVLQNTPVTFSVALDQIGGDYGIPDVWIVADTSFGLYSYRGYQGWAAGIYPYEGMVSAITAAFELPSLYLPVGSYTLYLGVDDNADRLPDGTWWDAVSVDVAASGVW
jgi:hypothetical protein